MATASTETNAAAASHDHARSIPAWAMWIFLALWVPLMLVAVAAPIAGPIYLRDKGGLADPFTRLGLLNGAGYLTPVSDEAIKLGIARGSLLLAVDGHLITAPPSDPGYQAIIAKMARGRDGSIAHLTFRSPGGAIRTVDITRSDAHLDGAYASAGLSRSFVSAFSFLIGFISIYAMVAAAVLLFIKGGRRPVSLLLAFALPLLGAGFVSGQILVVLLPSGPQLFVGVLGFSSLGLAIMLFPDGRFEPRAMRWWALAMVILAPFGATSIIPYGLWVPLHSIFLAGAAVSLVVRYRHLPAGSERQQMRWALFGFTIGAAALVVAVTNAILFNSTDLSGPLFVWYNLIQRILNCLMFLPMAAGLLISLLRYRLYDADAVIVRSVSFGALALVLVALFAGSEKVIELLGEEYFGEKLGVLAGGIGAAFAALMIVPLHHRLTHWAEHKFQKQLIRLKHGLPLLVGDMRETAPVARIAAATLDSVSHGVRASRAALVFEGALLDARGIDAEDVERWLAVWTPPLRDGFDINTDDPMFPLRVPLAADGHGRIGWLLLGPRPDGSFYGKDERETLALIADPVSRALEIAAAREKREAAELARWSGQESLNAEIKTVNVELVRVNSELLRVIGSLDEKLGQIIVLPGVQVAP